MILLVDEAFFFFFFVVYEPRAMCVHGQNVKRKRKNEKKEKKSRQRKGKEWRNKQLFRMAYWVIHNY